MLRNKLIAQFCSLFCVVTTILVTASNFDKYILVRAPIGCDSSGFFNEILSLVVGLRRIIDDEKRLFVEIGKCTDVFLSSLEQHEALTLKVLQRNFEEFQSSWENVIVIQFKLPNSPFPSMAHKHPYYTIGRVMTESTVLSQNEVQYISAVDEIWVPSQFHMDVYVSHGIPLHMIHVIRESVNIDLFASNSSSAINNIQYKTTLDGDASLHNIISSDGSKNTTIEDEAYIFLSIFKFERRKGWDVLLSAYWSAFDRNDNVELLIRSYKPSWERGTSNLTRIFSDYARSTFMTSLKFLPRVTWIHNDIDRRHIADLYSAADAFVLPTRGEGWCLPCTEAMASGLPIIVTNFSGPTEYLHTNWSYPLAYDKLNTDGSAEPNVNHLSHLMKFLYNNREEADTKGKAAQKYAQVNFHPNTLAKNVMRRLNEILVELEVNQKW